METADSAKKAELAVQAAKIKGELAKAEYNIALKEKRSVSTPRCSCRISNEMTKPE